MRRVIKLLIFLIVAALIIKYVREFLASDGDVPNSLNEPDTEPYDEAPLGGEVSPDLLEILVCPEDKGSLELVDEGKFLLNPRNGYKYPIRGGVPVMLIEEGQKHQDKSLIAAE